MWIYVYFVKYLDIKLEDEWWKEEWDCKLKEERSWSKDFVFKEDGKESISSDCKLFILEEFCFGSKEFWLSVYVFVFFLFIQYQFYIFYMYGYFYSQFYDFNYFSYWSMFVVMMQNYLGFYLFFSYFFFLYGSKVLGGEDVDKV